MPRAIGDPGQTNDLSAVEPDVVQRAEAMFTEQHTPTPFRESGQSQEAWERELRELGIQLPNNVDG